MKSDWYKNKPNIRHTKAKSVLKFKASAVAEKSLTMFGIDIFGYLEIRIIKTKSPFNKKLMSDWYINKSHQMACLSKECVKTSSICDE